MADFALRDIEYAVKEKFATPLDLNNAIRTEEVTVQFENNSQADTDLRNVRLGNGSVAFAGGEFDLSTPATADGRQALETANIGEYAAGLPAGVGILVQKDSLPVGYAEWGYGGEAFDDELRWHLASDGSFRFERERGGVVTEIPRSLWEPSTTDRQPVTNENGDTVGTVTGLDPLDGTGPSEIDISPPLVSLFGVDFVLYGGGGFAPWVVRLSADKAVEKTYPFIFHPTTETILSQFNQPIFARLDNDGTATADTLQVTERQFTQYGTTNYSVRATQHCFDLEKSVSGPTCLVGLRRAAAGGGTQLDLIETVLSADANAHVWYLVDPDVTANGGDANWELPARDFAGNTPDPSETRLEVNESLEVDPATGVALDGDVLEGASSGGPPGSRATAGKTDFESSPFIRDRPVAVMVEPLAGGTSLSSQEGVVNLTEAI